MAEFTMIVKKEESELVMSWNEWMPKIWKYGKSLKTAGVKTYIHAAEQEIQNAEDQDGNK